MSEPFLIKSQVFRTPTSLKRDSNTNLFPARFAKILIFKSPATASAGLRFPACNFVKKETRQKCFFCQFYKNLKNIFWENTSGWLLLVFIWEFWEVFQNTSFMEHLISSTSYRIPTTLYSKKLFHKCFSSILYKNNK